MRACFAARASKVKRLKLRPNQCEGGSIDPRSCQMNYFDLIFDCQVKQGPRDSDAIHSLDFKTILVVGDSACQIASIF